MKLAEVIDQLKLLLKPASKTQLDKGRWRAVAGEPPPPSKFDARSSRKSA
jgi:hypothetical protein